MKLRIEQVYRNGSNSPVYHVKRRYFLFFWGSYEPFNTRYFTGQPMNYSAIEDAEDAIDKFLNPGTYKVVKTINV